MFFSNGQSSESIDLFINEIYSIDIFTSEEIFCEYIQRYVLLTNYSDELEDKMTVFICIRIECDLDERKFQLYMKESSNIEAKALATIQTKGSRTDFVLSITACFYHSNTDFNPSVKLLLLANMLKIEIVITSFSLSLFVIFQSTVWNENC